MARRVKKLSLIKYKKKDVVIASIFFRDKSSEKICERLPYKISCVCGYE
jgi:hypothetical protein